VPRADRPGKSATVRAAASPPDPAHDQELDQDVREVLSQGELTITGRLTDASNITLLGSVELDGVAIKCVYKPIRGERPLWDFPDGTLAGREVASYQIAEAAGWHCVPCTVLRDGPYGSGMVQQWIDDADPDLAADLVPETELPDGWRPILRAVDDDGAGLLLVHSSLPALAVLAGFDLVVNNADRKASHILPTPDGRIRGVDHGVTMHVDDKLRTILWGWAGERLPDAVIDGLRRLRAGLAKPGSTLGENMSAALTRSEVRALTHRVAALVAKPVFPEPPEHRTPIPWPPL
jgi:uncharacterized repeat protein (TIGR03843 family)